MKSKFTFLIKAQIVALFFTLSATAQQFQVSVVESTDPINLTAVGTTDWKHFGSADPVLAIDSMNRGGINSAISNFTTTGGNDAAYYNDDRRKVSWTNGSVLPTNANDSTGVYYEGLDNGFTFTIKVKPGNNKLYLYLGGYQSAAKLTLTSSNPSVVQYTNTTDNTPIADGLISKNYTVNYNTLTEETVTVNWVSVFDFGGYCNVTMIGAAYVNTGGATPLDVTSYTAKKSANSVELNWTTANEVNVKNFTIERSVDGKTFTTIATPATTGSGSYTYTDKSPAKGINYYKLSSVDVDGTKASKGIKSLIFSLEDAGFTIFPNPTSDVLYVNTKSALAKISVVDLSGKVLISKVISGTSSVSLANLPKGVYLVKLTENGTTTVKKVVKN